MIHYEYPETQQFRTIAKNVKTDYTFRKEVGGVSVRVTEPPTLTFFGTIKLHGTNTAVVVNPNYSSYPQSRNNILTAEQDSYGFYDFYSKRGAHFIEIRKYIEAAWPRFESYPIVIYGEWAGDGIQQDVGISNIERSFFIFAICVKLDDRDFWLDDYGGIIRGRGYDNIYDIRDFLTYCVAIDFKNPQLSQNVLAELTEKVEHECPVAKKLGHPNTVGEGIVWTCYNPDGSVYRFKVKGKKHSSSKVTTLAKVDVEKLNNINEFVEYAASESRLAQGLTELFHEGDLDVEKLGHYIRWVMLRVQYQSR